jgi:hypothetical protein
MAATPNSEGRGVSVGERWFFYLVLCVVLVAALLRFGWLFSLPLTNDETSALMRLRVSGLGELINGVVWNDGHPMLVQVFLWYWTQWFGTAVWVIKLPFLLCGFGSVVLMIHIGMRLGRPWAGLMAAAMLATLQFPVMYSEIARPYAPGLLLSLWAFYLWLRWVGLCGGDSLQMGDSISPMGLLALSGYLGASNHYFNGLFLGLLFLLGLVWLPRRFWLRYLWPWVLMVAMYGHQLGIFLHHLQVGSPGWLSVPTLETLGKHVAYSAGYSLWVWVMWLLVGMGVLILWMRGPREAGESGVGVLGFRANRAFYSVLLLYGLPVLIAYLYSVYRAPVFQDSVLLFSFPFGLLSAFWWVDSVRLPLRWKSGLVLLTLGLNVYTLLVDRNHATLFGNQSYDGAVRTFQRWGLEKTGGKLGSMRGEAAMWVYGFEPFFMEFHAKTLGWDLVGLERRGLQVQYLREETDDYGLFRDRLKALKGDDFYYVNMVGMDPMLRVWIQDEFPVLVREAQGPGYHILHFSRRGSGKRPLYRTEIASVTGDVEGQETLMSTEQYFPVCTAALDSLGLKRYEAEFVAEAEVVVGKEWLKAQDLRLVVTVNDGGGKQVRFLDRSLGDMDYRVEEVAAVDDSLCVVKMYLCGRLVDVPWGAWRNHGCVGDGYRLQVFIDNAGRHPVGIRRIACTFWEGNGEVYGLVNPRIP